MERVGRLGGARRQEVGDADDSEIDVVCNYSLGVIVPGGELAGRRGLRGEERSTSGRGRLLADLGGPLHSELPAALDDRRTRERET